MTAAPRLFACIVLALLIPLRPVAAVEIGPGQITLEGRDDVRYLEDRLQNQALTDVLPLDDQFVPLTAFAADPAGNETAVWIRVPVTNHQGREATMVLDLRTGHLWKADFYATRRSGEPVSLFQYNSVKARHNPLELRGSVGFPFTVPAHSERVLYVRVKTYNIAGVGLTLRSLEGQLSRLAADHILTGILLGIIAGVFVYNAVILLSFSDRSYHYFLGFLLFAIPYLLAVRRVGLGLVGSVLPVDALSLSGILAMVALLFMALFTRAYLRTRVTMLPIHVLLTGLVIAGPLSVMGNYFLPGVFAGADGVVMLASLLTMGAAGVVGLVKRQRNAFTYSLSVFVFLGTAVLSFIYDLGVRPYRFTVFFADAVQYGVVVCALLLSVSVTRRVREMRVERARLMHLNQSKSELLAAVSHELRTPLANLWLLIERAGSGPPDRILHPTDPVFTSMRRQAERLAGHVDNLMLHSRLDLLGRTPNPRLIAIEWVVKRSVEDFMPKAEQAEITLSCSERAQRVRVNVDMELFSSVMGNLLDNALRVTPAGGSVLVDISQPEGRDDQVTISVTDSGPGVPESVRHNLFEPYVTAGSPGLGLGLALSRQVVDMHGGTIRHEPTAGGARFVIVLPVVSPNGEQENSDSPNPGVPRPETPAVTGADQRAPRGHTMPVLARVLVVEDDDQMRTNLEQLLAPHMTVLTAANVDEANARLDACEVDGIVADVMMPGLSGFQWYRSLQEEKRLPPVPFVFLTARADQESELEGLGLGAVDYIRKPFHGPVLVAKLTALVNANRVVAVRLRETLVAHVNQWPGAGHATLHPDAGGSDMTHPLDVEEAAILWALTSRQVEVLRLVVKGYTNREIAELLDVSVKTIDYHVSAILKRVGVERRTQLSHELRDPDVLE